MLCPGKAYDRSPCGTGTSAKLACLAADGALAEGETWVQESITGSVFGARYRRRGEDIVPTVVGRAWVNGEATLIDVYAHRGFQVRPLSGSEAEEVFRLRLAIEPAAAAAVRRLSRQHLESTLDDLRQVL